MDGFKTIFRISLSHSVLSKRLVQKKTCKTLNPRLSSEVVLFENDEGEDDDEIFSKVNTIHQQESLQESLKESLKESLHDALNFDNDNNENR
ncbi:hypothetical protein Glove_300g28 [Diversispora epigaea]|uniref:Uncharacterized protein n=1 Tax=Diversispora epigaea TaxID=1348612 RepID=A0A397I2Z0_9GLOM|nr:hypothetical protein Glove_300g28 [Diversispora epigaea]